MDGIETKDILQMESNNYIQHMRNTSTWGGAIEIQSACNIWKLGINVHNIRANEKGQICFIPITTEILQTINITWSGGHYEPLIV